MQVRVDYVILYFSCSFNCIWSLVHSLFLDTLIGKGVRLYNVFGSGVCHGTHAQFIAQPSIVNRGLCLAPEVREHVAENIAPEHKKAIKRVVCHLHIVPSKQGCQSHL